MSSSSLKSINVVELPNRDKFVHFVFYSVFTASWFFALKNNYNHMSKLRLIVFVMAVVYGSLIELAQFLFGWGRDAELLDIVANTLGSAFAILILWMKKLRK